MPLQPFPLVAVLVAARLVPGAALVVWTFLVVLGVADPLLRRGFDRFRSARAKRLVRRQRRADARADARRPTPRSGYAPEP